MRIIVKCQSCGEELVADITISPLNEIILSVKPCNNIDCYDCKGCEMEKKLEEIRKVVV